MFPNLVLLTFTLNHYMLTANLPRLEGKGSQAQPWGEPCICAEGGHSCSSAAEVPGHTQQRVVHVRKV